MNCKICNKKSTFVFTSLVLNKYNVKYYFCRNCYYLQTEAPYWLEQAYSTPLLALDTGIMWRNIEIAKIFYVLIHFLFNKKKSFLDFGGGYGIFTRLMRDKGLDFYLHDQFLTNIIARGFEYKKQNKDFELITSVECFEHLENPIQEIESMLALSKNILFTTHLLPIPMPKPQDWFYYGQIHGQHISFYSLKTLQIIAKTYNLNLYSDKKFIHLLTPKKIKPLLFRKLIDFTHKGLWWYISKKITKNNPFTWIEKDGSFIKNKIFANQKSLNNS